MSREGRLRAALFVAGAPIAAAGFSPGPWGALQWAAYAPLMVLALEERPGRAFLLGWAYGTLGWAVALHWLAAGMSAFLSVPKPALWTLSSLFFLYHGLPYGLFAAAVSWLTPRLEARARLPRAAACWAVATLAMSWVETSWPVFVPVRVAVTQLWHLPLAQTAAWDGGLLITAAVMASNAALACAAARGSAGPAGWRPVLAAAAAAAVLFEVHGRAAMRAVDAASAAAPGGTAEVVAVQPVVSVMGAFDRLRVARNLGVLRGLTDAALAAGRADLVVWPESVFASGRRIEFRTDGARWSSPTLDGRPLDETAARELPDAPTMTTSIVTARPEGAPPWMRERRYNAALLFGRGGEFQGLTRKRFLLPFGEAVPLARRFPFLDAWFPGSQHLSPGVRSRVLRLPSGTPVGALVCYEDAVPRQTADMAGAGARLLVDMTNDAGLRDGRGLARHLHVSRLRAIETGLPLVRATNTGGTAFIDPAGRVVSSLAAGERGTLRASVPLPAGPSFYVRHARRGRAAANALFGLILVGAAFLDRRGGRG